jgi:hypothetical protein
MATIFKPEKAGLRLTAALLAAAAFANAWAHPPGRMTGGGSLLCPAVGRVTHGFELHCGTGSNPEGSNPPGPNNLEINFSGGDNFHLTSLEVANCSDDPSIGPAPPQAGFDTMTGSGSGTFNGSPASIAFTLTDAGEPGAGIDVAAFTITTATATVLECRNYLEGGNHQAHRPTGNKQ